MLRIMDVRIPDVTLDTTGKTRSDAVWFIAVHESDDIRSAAVLWEPRTPGVVVLMSDGQKAEAWLSRNFPPPRRLWSTRGIMAQPWRFA